jgi:hypothetical protein
MVQQDIYPVPMILWDKDAEIDEKYEFSLFSKLYKDIGENLN